MVPGIASVLDRLDALFGRSYVLGGVLPIFFAESLSVLIGYFQIPAVRAVVTWATGLTAWRQTVLGLAVVFVTAVAGFVYWALVPSTRRFLEGGSRGWLGRFGAWLLISGQRKYRGKLQDRVASTRQMAATFRSLAPPLADPRTAEPPTWAGVLKNARVIGDTVGKTANVSKATTDRLKDAVARQSSGAVISPDEVQKLVDALATDLRSGKAIGGEALDKDVLKTVDLFEYARNAATTDWYRALSDYRSRFPESDSVVAPTHLGNLAELQREYALSRYGIDADLFWPHFVRAAIGDTEFRKVLDEAKLRLDFSIAMTAMLAVLAIGWLSFMAVAGNNLWLALAIGFFFGGGSAAFYESAIAAQQALGEAARAMIDLFRFDVLKALHVQIPANDTEERATWEKVVGRAQRTLTDSITYAHPTTP